MQNIFHVPGKIQKAPDYRVADMQDEYQKALQMVLFNLDLAPCTLCSLSASTRQISWDLQGLYRPRHKGAAHPDQQGQTRNSL